MCDFTFLLLTKSIPFVFQLNPAVMYRASDNSLPSALLQAISAYYQAKLWNGPPSAAGETFPSWDLRLKKKCFITADQSAIQRCLEDGVTTKKNQNDSSQRKSISEGLVSEKKTFIYLQPFTISGKVPMNIVIWICNMTSSFFPDTWLSEVLFLFSFRKTKFKKLFHSVPAIFHISIICQIK